MVVHTYNPSALRWRQEDQEYHAILGYVRQSLKAHTQEEQRITDFVDNGGILSSRRWFNNYVKPAAPCMKEHDCLVI